MMRDSLNSGFDTYIHAAVINCMHQSRTPNSRVPCSSSQRPAYKITVQLLKYWRIRDP